MISLGILILVTYAVLLVRAYRFKNSSRSVYKEYTMLDTYEGTSFWDFIFKYHYSKYRDLEALLLFLFTFLGLVVFVTSLVASFLIYLP